MPRAMEIVEPPRSTKSDRYVLDKRLGEGGFGVVYVSVYLFGLTLQIISYQDVLEGHRY